MFNRKKNSLTAKVGEHIPSGFSRSTISSCRSIEDEYDAYRGKDCMKKFCESLREQSIKKIIFKKKKMKLLAKQQQLLYENAKVCYICEEKFDNKYLKDKKYRKTRCHCH